ncbi:MAG: PAS domain-containing sensor histidine kinase [Anaerolineae bacterium]
MSSLFDPRTPGLSPDEMGVAAEEFIRVALDGLNDPIAILDSDGTILHVNRAWKRLREENSPQAPEYGIGQPYVAICDSSSQQSADAALLAETIRQIQQGKSEEASLEYLCPGPAEQRWFQVHITRFSWYGQTRIVVMHQNITDMKSVQAELHDSKRWLEAVLDNLVDGVITFDEQGIIQSLNRAGAYIFGYEQGAAVGLDIRALLVGLEADSSDEELAAFLRRVSSLGDEMEGRRSDGSPFSMYLSVNSLSHDQQQFYSAVIQDFTERKFLESEVWEKERLRLALEKERELRDLKNSFISMMSHDLKTPLAAIRLANSMLRNYGDRSSEEEKRESYDAIDQQVAYLSELINDVMTISRSDFTGAELERSLIDVETYCRDIIEALQLTYRMQRIINFVGTDRRVEADIDTKLMRRAITNLLTNAIKYSPNGKPVTLELTCHDQQVLIKVMDEGIGIPPSDLTGLFEPFKRASNVGGIQGTGLGLAIAKQAVELHGGSIRVESTLGAGTAFIITLPAISC